MVKKAGCSGKSASRRPETCGIEPLTLSLEEVPLDARTTQRALVALGESFGRPWSADWKLAAAAAWTRLR
jgi:hypothetical protein